MPRAYEGAYRSGSRLLTIVAVIVGVSIAWCLVLGSFSAPTSAPAVAEYCGCPVGAPCAQRISLTLLAPAGTFPTQAPNVARLSVWGPAEVPADDLQFRSAYDGVVSGAPFNLTVLDPNGTFVASYDSADSSWIGQGSGSYGGWVDGGGAVVETNDTFVFSFSETTYSVVGIDLAPCAGLVQVYSG